MTGGDKLAVDVESIDRELIRLLALRGEALVRALQASKSGTSRSWGLGAADESAVRAFAEQTGLDGEQAVGWLKHAANINAAKLRPAEPIAFLGPIYSYSYLAAVKHFGLGSDLVPVATISAAFEEVIRNQAAFAVVPIENSTDGRVVDTLGMFAKTPVEICGEVLLPIHHCLLGLSRRPEIQEVHSKPQAISQCRQWLAEHLPHAKLVEVASTAIAAEQAAQNPAVGAIASREAGIHHGLRIVDENIEDNMQNVTRFAVIGNRSNVPGKHDKTSIMFQLEHQPGALANAMVAFQSASVNLTWIESFPLPNCPNEYLFFVELDGHRDDAAVQQAIANLAQQTRRQVVLGSYPRGVVG